MATANPPPVTTTNVATGLTSESRGSARSSRTEQPPDAKRRGITRVVLAQFRNVMVILLLVAGAVAAFLGETADLAAIVIIVLLNAAFGAHRNTARNEPSLPCASGRTAGSGPAQRHVTTVPSADVVPGDIVLLEAGKIVPADLLLVDTSNLDVAEALLTGEAEPVDKSAESRNRRLRRTANNPTRHTRARRSREVGARES